MRKPTSRPALALAVVLGALPLTGCGRKSGSDGDGGSFGASPTSKKAERPRKLSEWRPDEALLDQLAPAVDVGAYQVRPPKGYTSVPTPPGAPKEARAFTWVGSTRPDGTAPQFMVVLITLPADAGLVLPDQLLVSALRALHRLYESWSQTDDETGRVNGLTFLRARWSGTDAAKKWKLHGFVYVYVAPDDNLVVQLRSQDVEPNHEQALKVAEAAALTFRKK
jgi:hypothetical protein